VCDQQQRPKLLDLGLRAIQRRRGPKLRTRSPSSRAGTAAGVVAGIVTTIVGTFAIPFRNFEGPLRWLLILAQFPIVPFVVAYMVYRITLMIYLAADQGRADAQFNLGGRYINGEGVPQDDTHQGARPMVVEDYSLDRILQRVRAASPTGEVSPATFWPFPRNARRTVAMNRISAFLLLACCATCDEAFGKL
jgi:hypothetical protein